MLGNHPKNRLNPLWGGGERGGAGGKIIFCPGGGPGGKIGGKGLKRIFPLIFFFSPFFFF